MIHSHTNIYHQFWDLRALAGHFTALAPPYTGLSTDYTGYYPGNPAGCNRGTGDGHPASRTNVRFPD